MRWRIRCKTWWIFIIHGIIFLRFIRDCLWNRHILRQVPDFGQVVAPCIPLTEWCRSNVSLEDGESNGWHGTTIQLNFLLEQWHELDHASVLHHFDWECFASSNTTQVAQVEKDLALVGIVLRSLFEWLLHCLKEWRLGELGFVFLKGCETFRSQGHFPKPVSEQPLIRQRSRTPASS